MDSHQEASYFRFLRINSSQASLDASVIVGLRLIAKSFFLDGTRRNFFLIGNCPMGSSLASGFPLGKIPLLLLCVDECFVSASPLSRSATRLTLTPAVKGLHSLASLQVWVPLHQVLTLLTIGQTVFSVLFLGPVSLARPVSFRHTE